MREHDRVAICRIVRAYIDPKRPGHKPRQGWKIIEAANNGRLDGFLVTASNQSLFRAYRNSVSCNPQDLIDEAMLLEDDE
jgi:hypothetical protein